MFTRTSGRRNLHTLLQFLPGPHPAFRSCQAALTLALSRRGLCTISRFWILLSDLYRYKFVDSRLIVELLCKAPAGRGDE